MEIKKVKFVGFWSSFDENDNFIINILRKRYQVELSDNPDYLFSSCFSEEYLKYDCVRIFYTGENICPNFNLFDYGIGFECMEYNDRYIRFPLYCVSDLYKNDVDEMLIKHCIESEKEMVDRDFCAFVVSNDKYSDAFRVNLFNELSKYKKVNSGGRVLNNIGIPEGVPDKLAFQKKHKFSLAIENNSHPGYTTEKIVQAFAAQTVPIYWGDESIGMDFNEKAFINLSPHISVEEAVKIIIDIDNDDEKYINMLKEPALKDNTIVDKYRLSLENFLYNIMDQDANNAKRTNRIRYGKDYLNSLIRKNELYILQTSKYYRLADKALKIHRRIRGV